jgi:antitoxin component YwqK of YwqJK toxin-antitoxin module
MSCNYVNGLIEGEYKEYHENGNLSAIYNYVNDKLEGEYKSYHPNGNLYRQHIYSYGEIIQTIK